MADRSGIRSVTSTLSFKLFVVLFVSVLLLFSVNAALASRFQRQNLETLVKTEAYRTSDLIRQSLFSSMLANERERTYDMIVKMANEPGVERIRIFNKRGEIKFSSDDREIGRSVDLQAEACYVCHASSDPLTAVPSPERARVFRLTRSDHRVLGMINPIGNEESCWNAACHAHGDDQSVLGVLDVQMSMQTADEALAAGRRHTVEVAVIIILLSSLLMAAIVYRALHVPTQKLRHGTEALTAGNLDVEIDLKRSDELGALAVSFNKMARSLKAADQELREWSQTLEDRVQEKTEALDEVNKQMIQVERTASLGRMAATVAHELNNPLSGIVTYAKLVAKKVEDRMPEGRDREKILEHLDLVRSESLRCGNIVRDLLTYARGGQAQFEPARFNDIVERALKLVAHHIQLGQVRSALQLESRRDALICDPEQLLQALVALLVNAVEAMPEGGNLTVRTWDGEADGEERLFVSVRDTGVGIPREVQPHIFDPFFSTKSDAKGVGLGLAVVYGIVQRHEGSISVDSKRGEGTTFVVTLPRHLVPGVHEALAAQEGTVGS
ncbi:MAG: ATP-binding protein [Gemmatimonadota bacterium]|nr:ATP-binding protein [Gemmatimonadota bacterium]